MVVQHAGGFKPVRVNRAPAKIAYELAAAAADIEQAGEALARTVRRMKDEGTL